MAKVIMVQGTTSNAGKSLVTAGLCRIFHQDGYRVAPFKSQNMALNSFVTMEGKEMGRAQVMQAEAAGIEPHVDMNPILLKPTGDMGSQIVVHGEVMGNMRAMDYYKNKMQFVGKVMESYNRLSEKYDIIVIEGAGSPAEINLKSQDIVNMGMARMADSPVIIVGDIDRGGVFASLAGTMLLLDEEEKERVKGFVINKFRGDLEILKPGLHMLEEIAGKPVLGVLPYLTVDIDDEDSLSDKLTTQSGPALIDIAVIRLPRISNFTDFNPLEYFPGVSVRYVKNVRELKNPDLILLPGSKNTMEDLLWLRQSGLEAAILKVASKETPIIGICGGYQMLGKTLHDPHGVEHGGEMAGMGLLPVETTFEPSKVRTRVTGKFETQEGIFASFSGVALEGYEIHMGVTTLCEGAVPFTQIQEVAGGTHLHQDGAVFGNVMGSYVHGIFDKEEVAKSLIQSLFASKGLDWSTVIAMDMSAYKEIQYNILADALRKALDMEQIYQILDGKEA